MARAMRASTSSAVIVHSENGFDSRKLDEGRMAHPPLGRPLPCEPNYGRLKIVPSKTRRHGLADPLPTTGMPKGCVQRPKKAELALRAAICRDHGAQICFS